MYRDDQEALLQRAEASTKEADHLRRENEAMRAAMNQGMALNHYQPQPLSYVPPTYVAMPAKLIYSKHFDVRALPMSERARIANHAVRPFPVWAIGLLHILTLGIFPLIHFGLIHDKLPQADADDPSAGKAIGFQFIPVFWMYWIFFSSLRLADRLTLQFRLRGLGNRAPRGLLLATCILSVIPYIGWFLAIPIMWTIAVCVLQSSVNRVAALPPTQWDATPQIQGY